MRREKAQALIPPLPLLKKKKEGKKKKRKKGRSSLVKLQKYDDPDPI